MACGLADVGIGLGAAGAGTGFGVEGATDVDPTALGCVWAGCGGWTGLEMTAGAVGVAGVCGFALGKNESSAGLVSICFETGRVSGVAPVGLDSGCFAAVVGSGVAVASVCDAAAGLASGGTGGVDG